MNRFDAHTAIHQIIVVGLGGTGSQLARTLARILYDMNRFGLHLPSMLFVDPDQVEEKNVGRQMFAAADCGQYKAELLARRFNYALGLNIAFDNAPFDPEVHMERYGTLLVGCVDNHIARQSLAYADALWLDCGNHAESGQIVFGTTRSIERVEEALRKLPDSKGVISVLPNASLIFPELLEEETAPSVSPEASCAELIEAGRQHLLINDAIATAAATYAYRLLYRKPLYSFMTFVTLDAVRPMDISREAIEAYIQRESV